MQAVDIPEEAQFAPVPPSRTPTSRFAELRDGWPTVVAAASGAGLGVSGLLTYTSGLFVIDLQRQIGLTRAAFGLTFFAATVAMALAMPVVGSLFDRRGLRAPLIFGSVMLATGFAALSLVGSVAAYVAVVVAIGLLAATSTPVGYTRAVSAAFDRSRGLALGLTQMGIGVSAAVVPPLVALAIATWGWRSGYLLLAVLALCGILPAAIGFRAARAGQPQAAPAGPEFASVLRRPLFWIQLGAFTLMALSFAGMLPHFVPMLRDLGVSPARAGALAGLIGIAVIVSRVITGWLADIVNGAFLAAAACLLCGAGCVILAFGGAGAAPVGALALGCAMGAEADLVGILTARNFGIRSYGRAYALQYAAFMLAAGAGPAWIGALADSDGSYHRALLYAATGLAACALLFLLIASGSRRSAATAAGAE